MEKRQFNDKKNFNIVELKKEIVRKSKSNVRRKKKVKIEFNYQKR